MAFSSVSIEQPRRLPTWLSLVGSAVVLFHLTAVINNYLSVFSGPWPTMDGPPMPATPPQFAYSLNTFFAPKYLQPIKLMYTYPMYTPRNPEIRLEFHLKDQDGNVIKVVRLPDEDANSWVQQREKMFAAGLGEDEMVQPPQMPVVPAQGQDVPRVRVLRAEDPKKPIKLKLEDVSVNSLIGQQQPSMKPSDWSKLLMHSYARHLCANYGAAKVEFIRYHKRGYPPDILFADTVEPFVFDEWTSNLGEISK